MTELHGPFDDPGGVSEDHSVPEGQPCCTMAPSQIDELANYIMADFPYDIKEGGAVDVAIRLLKSLKAIRERAWEVTVRWIDKGDGTAQEKTLRGGQAGYTQTEGPFLRIWADSHTLIVPNEQVISVDLHQNPED